MIDDNSQDSGDISSLEIQQWLVNHIARVANINKNAISVEAPLTHYGLDSSTVLGLACELEDWLGKELEHTSLYDYDSISALSEYLASSKS